MGGGGRGLTINSTDWSLTLVYNSDFGVSSAQGIN